METICETLTTQYTRPAKTSYPPIRTSGGIPTPIPRQAPLPDRPGRVHYHGQRCRFSEFPGIGQLWPDSAMNVRLARFRVIRGNVTRASPGHVILCLLLAKDRHRPWLGRRTGSMATVAPSPVLHNTTAPYLRRPGRYLAWSIHDRAVDNARLTRPIAGNARCCDCCIAKWRGGRR
jgi:hypothetical protein